MSRLLFLGILISSALSLLAEGKTEPAKPMQIHISATTSPREIDLKEMREVASEMQKRISAFHKGHQANMNFLRIVYFCAKDSEPFPQFEERLDRIMKDVSDFYEDGMKRFGFKSKGLPLEREKGRVVLHVVHGTETAQHYEHESGDKTKAQIREALADKFDLDKEHVLVIYNLCRKEPDGRYVFHAPYYGDGTYRSGICHAADCELLDTRLLTETNRNIVYKEHYYSRVEQTVAKFNSWYIGGIAHELGHGLGLPHDAGTPGEPPKGNTSLMCDGNLHYRENLWGGSQPAFLSFASALQFASHPLFTGSNRGRWGPAKVQLKNVDQMSATSGLKIRAQIEAEIEPYAVIASLYRKGAQSDHHNIAFPALVQKNEFTLQIDGVPAGTYQVSIITCHVNGQTSRLRLPLEIVADK